MSESLTLREYANREGISLGSAYRRVWEGRVPAKQLLGRWVIEPENQAQADSEERIQKLKA
jgi:hypothetical protein